MQPLVSLFSDGEGERLVGISRRVAMTRTASCQCRGFRVVVEAEPDTVSVCHCQICQRRTGVPLTCNAYFPKSKVRLEGEHRIYTRECPEGRKLHNHFCPTCGSTVGWTLDLRPNQFGVAVGCFNDRNFPPPVASIWEEEMCAWTMLPAGIQHFPRARPVPSASLAACFASTGTRQACRRTVA